MPASMLSRPMPNQPASRPVMTMFLALSVPACCTAIAVIGTLKTTAGFTPCKGQLVGRDAGVALVDDNGRGFDRQLRAEPAEIVPVERHRHIERAVGIEHGPGGQAQAAGGFAAADLRAEALGHDAMIALQRGRGDQGFPRGNHAVAAGTGNAYNQVFTH